MLFVFSRDLLYSVCLFVVFPNVFWYSLVFFCRLRPLTFIKESEKTDLLRKNTKKIYKAEIEKQTCRGAAGNELETHLSRGGDWD